MIVDEQRQKQTVSEVKRILATLLFTDIVGSTEHARRPGDGGWRAVLSQHHTAVRAEIARSEGIEVTRLATDSLSASIPPRARSNVPRRRERL